MGEFVSIRCVALRFEFVAFLDHRSGAAETCAEFRCNREMGYGLEADEKGQRVANLRLFGTGCTRATGQSYTLLF
jgi:hypothetical protein